MARTADKAVFLATNVLIYSSFPGSPLHEVARARLSTLESSGALFWISRQVLREFLAVVTRPDAVAPTPTPAALALLMRQFAATFHIADEDVGVTNVLVDLITSHSVRGKQVHDDNIVATMKRYAIPSLFTHNTADFARYVKDIRLLPMVL